MFSIIATVCLFLGITVLQATSTFWTIETLEVWNAFTYGGNYAAQYPMSIYGRWFQRFFTAVIPLALVSYYPGARFLDATRSGRSTRSVRSPASHSSEQRSGCSG